MLKERGEEKKARRALHLKCRKGKFLPFFAFFLFFMVFFSSVFLFLCFYLKIRRCHCLLLSIVVFV